MSTKDEGMTVSPNGQQTDVSRSAQRLAQVIVCKCGSKFAACVAPECYTEADWMKDVRKYVKQGCTVEVVEAGSFRFERCKCAELAKQAEAQMSMF